MTETPPAPLPDDVQKAWRELHSRFMELLLQVTMSFCEQKPTAPKYAQEMVRWSKEYDTITAALAEREELRAENERLRALAIVGQAAVEAHSQTEASEIGDDYNADVAAGAAQRAFDNAIKNYMSEVLNPTKGGE